MSLADRQQQFPDQPWRWDPRWNDTAIADNSVRSMAGVWLTTLIWLLVTIPVFVALLREPPLNPAGHAAVFLLPLSGVLFLIGALRVTYRFRHFGVSTLTIAPFPAHPGEPLNVNICASAALAGASDVDLKLQCVRRTRTGSGRDTFIQDTVLWEDEQHTPPGKTADATCIRTSFAPPADAVETSMGDPRNLVRWQLLVRSAGAGQSFRTSFDLPVFARRAGESTPPVVPFPRTSPDRTRVGPPTAALADQRISVRSLAGEAFAVDFPAARRVGSAIVMTLLAVGFDAAAAFMARDTTFTSSADAGLFAVVFRMLGWFGRIAFPVGFGLFGLILTLVTLSAWFVRVTVTADRSGLTIIRSVLGIQFRTAIPAAAIARLAATQTETIGDTVYYSLKVTKIDGDTATFGSGIEDPRIAGQLATAMLDAIGGLSTTLA